MEPRNIDKAHKADSVRALARGLDILRHVNRAGACRAREIAIATGIPRPTVYRLLETLEEQGYVAFSPTSNLVRVTRIAASLGDGFAVTSQICQVAGPIFAEYAPAMVWPLDLTTYENTAMVVQETTHNRSPLSIDRGMTGFRLPMLRTSAGRCYLGLCPTAERELIMEHLGQIGHPDDVPFLDDSYLYPMLRDVQQWSRATRMGEEFQPKTASFAVPVWSADRVVACISVIWTRGAMRLDEALHNMEGPLRDISVKISNALDP
jgi:IclR family mhp operon transcriptional activator